MTEYEVEWRETHRTTVNADSEEDAREYVARMNREASKTFVKIDDLRVSKRYRVFWTEHHECEVIALSKEEAAEAAEHYAGEHDTCIDVDNYEIEES